MQGDQEILVLISTQPVLLMNISICAATAMELSLFKQQATTAMNNPGRHRLRFVVTGIGMLQSSFFIQQHLKEADVDFILQIGIAGCFNSSVALSSVWMVDREYLGSLGVVENREQAGLSENATENWQDIFDLGLQVPDIAPFTDKALINRHIQQMAPLSNGEIGLATGVTVDEITTSPERMRTLFTRYGRPDYPERPLLESMEGASLHFNALQYNTPFVQLRAVSNYTGQRDKAFWDIAGAVKAVTAAGLDLICRL